MPKWNSLVHWQVNHMINQVFGIVRKEHIIFFFAKGVFCGFSVDWCRANEFCSVSAGSISFRWTRTSSYFWLRCWERIEELFRLIFLPDLSLVFLVCCSGLCSVNSGKLRCASVCLNTFLLKCSNNFIWVILKKNQIKIRFTFCIMFLNLVSLNNF